MLRFTFQTFVLFLSMVCTINGTDLEIDKLSNARLETARSHYENEALKEAKLEYLSMSNDHLLPWNKRLQALEELSKFNRMVAVQGYLRLINSPDLQRSAKLRIEIQLTRLTPDLTQFNRIVNDLDSNPLDHFNAAYVLQDWISPKHAVRLFKLLLEKINRIKQASFKGYSAVHPLDKLFDAANAIIEQLEINFLD